MLMSVIQWKCACRDLVMKEFAINFRLFSLEIWLSGIEWLAFYDDEGIESIYKAYKKTSKNH